MKAPAQILTALAIAGAAAYYPLSTRFQEAARLHETAQKRTLIKGTASGDAAGARGKEGAGGKEGDAKKEAAGRIPAGVPAAEADRILRELSGLDGKMMSSRQILALLEKIMSLPASHMEEAQTVIQGSKNPIMGAFLISALYSRWGELDPEAAKVALESSSGGNPIFKFAGAAALAAGWLEKDPDSLLKWLATQPAGGERRGRGPGMGGDMRQIMTESLLTGMGTTDPDTTEKLIASLPQRRRADAVMDMAERDPESDPREAAARAMVEAGDNPEQKEQVNRRLGRLLAERDPKEAIQYASELPENERGDTYRAAMDSWMRKDKAEATKWLKEQTPEVQLSAVQGMRREVGDMSYDEATSWSQQVSPQAGQEVIRMAMQENARRDPEAALRYLPDMTDETRPGGYEQIATEWTRKDAMAASEWIEPLPVGPEKDRAIQGMVQELRRTDPSSSTVWAASVNDEKMRTNLVTENATLWLKREPEAAAAWINETDTLTDDQKDHLLKR